MIKHTKKSGKTLISCLIGKIPYSKVFPLFGGTYNMSSSRIMKHPEEAFTYVLCQIFR